MAGDSKAKVIVYGATSFTARELLTYLDNHPQSHLFDVILSGRNLQRLQASAEKLEKKHKIVACQLDDQEGVKNLISQGDVVINLAGESPSLPTSRGPPFDFQVRSRDTMPKL
jgi:short subunit dehydrogenase-like uncharacterized protein